MVKVAWISRHPPLPLQILMLNRKLGDVEVTVISNTFTSIDEIIRKVKEIGAKYAVVVLPLSMIARLVKEKSITWLWAEMEPVHKHSCIGKECPDYNPDADVILPSPTFTRHLRFKEFKVIEDVKLVLKRWK